MKFNKILTLIFFPRKIYWSDWGNNSKIESADLNGDNRQVLVDKVTHWPNGMALDPQRRRLYWCDARRFSISYIELNTKEIKTIFQKASHPYDITIFGNYAYLTDWPRRVTRLNLSGKKNQKEKVVRFFPNTLRVCLHEFSF